MDILIIIASIFQVGTLGYFLLSGKTQGEEISPHEYNNRENKKELFKRLFNK